MQSIYVVATGQHVGKTTVSLGLMTLLVEHGLRVRFFKPVGQQIIECDGKAIDKDAILMQEVLGVAGALEKMSPVTVPSGFVERYLFDRQPEALKRRLLDAYQSLCHDCDIMVVEGTGHAGVGACLDLSNADVAGLISAHALLVVEGGIGSTIDQVALNCCLLRANNVPILGVIANKVWPEKRGRIERALRQGLANMGLSLLGCIPYDAALTCPQVGQIAKALGADVLCGGEFLDLHIENVIVAAMEPQNVLPRIKPRSLMITPGDRIDNILLALNSGPIKAHRDDSVLAMVLTGGLMPDASIVALIEASGMPVLMCKEDTYTVSAQIQRMVFKIQPGETTKIRHAQDLVRRFVDTELLLSEVSAGR